MLDTSVDKLYGVGDRKRKLLEKINIRTFGDLLMAYPHRYIDRRRVISVSALKTGALGCIEAKVVEVQQKRAKKEILSVTVESHFHQGEMVFFSPKYLKNAFEVGQLYYFFGKMDKTGMFFKMLQPEFAKVGTKGFLGIIPVYPLTAGISNKEMIAYKKGVLSALQGKIMENLPEFVVQEAKLVTRMTAFAQIHFPDSAEAYKAAKRRLVFEELFILQLKLMLLKQNYHKPIKAPYTIPEDFEFWISRLPFQLTQAQKRTLDEIKADITSGYAMNRLIQGDVGSGKTILAFAAIFLAVLNHKQAVLMAPTALLAEQHYEGFKKIFGNTITVALLTSDVKAKNKEALKNQIALGDIKVVIGTHAIIQEDVVFERLGLVITDEQHRFGIRQRMNVALKGNQPHTLIMSATPIPRTLSLILYGDMDVSLVDELPEGRKPIKTHFIKPEKVSDMYGFIDKRIQEGRQVYVVCPLVEDSEAIDLTSATGHYEHLRNRFPDYEIGLVHGKMKSSEKETIMNAFHENKIQILVSTTVIEVGINVPNATIMVVMDSERFGLSQLHQLRGRVGRGEAQSYCFLLSEKLGKTSKERIESLVNSSSGFEIAERDLMLRGPGEVFGLKQHGLPELRLASLIEDKKTLKEVQKYVKMIIAEYEMNNVQVKRYIQKLSNELETWFTL